MCYRRALLDNGFSLRRIPKMLAFFERPGYAMINGSRRLADLWVHYVDL